MMMVSEEESISETMESCSISSADPPSLAMQENNLLRETPIGSMVSAESPSKEALPKPVGLSSPLHEPGDTETAAEGEESKPEGFRPCSPQVLNQPHSVVGSSKMSSATSWSKKSMTPSLPSDYQDHLGDLEAGIHSCVSRPAAPTNCAARKRTCSGSVFFSSPTGMSFEFARTSVKSSSTSSSKDPGRSVSVDVSRPKYIENAFIGFLATLLAFNSGFSNGVCLSGLVAPDDLFNKQSTSGYTGTYTKSALAVADKDMESFPGVPRVQFIGFQVCMILSFMLGSCITGLLNPRPAPWRIAPTFAPAFLLGCIFMTIASVLANTLEQAGDGTPHFFYFVALANGVQNGISSMYSANLIRTTHLTGTSTDIGLFMGQLLRGNTKNTWKLGVLCSLALSFWFGGFVSFYAVRKWLQHALIVNAAVFFWLFFLYLGFIMWNLHLPLHRALRGTWHWQRSMHQLKFRDATNGAVQPEECLLTIFHAMDLDQDGFLDKYEFEEGLKAHGLSYVSRCDLVYMFEVCDRDGDGKICPQDWLSLINGHNVLVG